jgi:hypothetical protein
MPVLSRIFRRASSYYFAAKFRATPTLACIRVDISQGKWKGKNPASLPDLTEAIKDLEVKPKDKGALSLYVVSSRRQGCRVTLMHMVTNCSPNKTLSFIFIPVSCLLNLSYNPQIVRSCDWRHQHPVLNKHHFVVYGLTSKNARLELAAAILNDPNHLIVTWSRRALKRRGRILMRGRCVRKFMKFEEKWS